MATAFNTRKRIRRFFGHIESVAPMPNLIEVQKSSYESFLQRVTAPAKRTQSGLQEVFRGVFPILATPFHEDESVDLDSMRRLVAFMARIGVDESGKGDFFGPLCVAAVYVNESVVRAWQDAGIQDSKNIGSDKRIAELAKLIRDTPGCHSEVLALGGTNYNQRYREERSLNPLLAKGHVSSILAVLAPAHHLNPPPEHAIIDQFAATETTVAREAKARGLKLKLVQRHKAEEDLAVAAASILARHEFVTRLAAMGKDLGIELPKGASSLVDKVAKQIVEQHGVATLARVGKMHFRTALRAQGLPEPPKVEWKRK